MTPALELEAEAVQAGLGISAAGEGPRGWEALAELEMPLRVQIRMASLTLRQVRALSRGDVLISHWAANEEVPLEAGGVALGWCEFEVVDGQMAVRLTRLG